MRDVEIVRGLLGDLRTGEPRGAGALTLVPLFGGRPGPRYLLAEDALAAGTLEIGELGQGVVPQLVARNKGPDPVLILEGEHLAGARQDRVLNVTVLVPAASEIPIPVSCVERGRWSYRGAARFRVEPAFSPPRVRRTKVSSVATRRRRAGDALSDQGAVWDAVDRALFAARAASPTGRLGDVVAERGRDLERTVEAAGEPLPGQTGTLAVVGGRPAALDIFDRPETLRRLWPRLVRGYALDALGAAAAQVEEGAARGFLARLAEGEATAHDGVGLGTEVVLTAPEAVGAALVWREAVVHLAAFATGPEVRRSGDRPVRAAGPIEPPSRRRPSPGRGPGCWFGGGPTTGAWG